MKRSDDRSQKRLIRASGMPPKKWPGAPVVFEINTWVWIAALTQKYGRTIDLGTVPGAEWDGVAADGVDAVWLMGVWQRSPAGIALANKNAKLREEFRHALPDFKLEDNVGSPYCVRDYKADQRLGGPDGLSIAREELAKRGLKLILDYVPNHVAPDHPWVQQHPDYFIRGKEMDLQSDPASFIDIQGNVLACGRDPYFPAWPDVVQLNAFSVEFRSAIKGVVTGIAKQCDGIRCDMAMLFLNEVFERTWKGRVGAVPTTEFWTEVITATKKAYPDFLFVAEAYWDMESNLHKAGFDYCYDKRLYDRLVAGYVDEVRSHLRASLGYQDKLVRFIENHDEPRAAATFSEDQEKAAAVTTATIPGAKLFYKGQFEGNKVRLPVFLGRAPEEKSNAELAVFYSRLVAMAGHGTLHDGHWHLCDVWGWPDNGSCRNLLAWVWTKAEDWILVVVNLSTWVSDGMVHLDLEWLRSKEWSLKDEISGTVFERNGDDIGSNGLYVKLLPWQFHVFHCTELKHAASREKDAVGQLVSE